MLSKALKRANEAVHLDNEQDYQAAINAYEEACSLLDAVLARTSTETERKKLTSIVSCGIIRCLVSRSLT